MTQASKFAAILGELVTGVAVIDEEHAYLIALERRLATALRSGDPAAAEAIFHELLEYMAEHFAHEESLMACLPPENAERHKEQHAEISARLVQFIGRPGGYALDPNELSAIMMVWLENHVRYWDMPLAIILKGKLLADGPTGDRPAH